MADITYITNSVSLEKYKNTVNEVIVISFILGVYNFSPYYSTFLNDSTKTILSLLGIFYIIYAILKSFLTGEEVHLKYYLLYDVSSNFIKKYFSKNNRKKTLNVRVIPETKLNDLLFIAVKLFYIPVMLNFTVNNFNVFSEKINGYLRFNIYNLNFFEWYGIILSVFFFVDTSYFLFGYLIESKKLGSTIRSVDKSVLSWVFTLACYPPFNEITTKIFPWAAEESNLMFSNPVNYLLLGLIVILFGVYLSATIALGGKCSNLTNRGTVSRGPYKFVRHPAYSAKVIAWWLMSLPVMNLFVFFNMSAWSFIYVMRALKEEDHLLQDKEYQTYFAETPFRFIPKVL